MLLKILLIDNSQTIKKVFNLSLKGYHYELQTAPDPNTALQLIKSFQPQLIFIDSLIQSLKVSEFIKKCHESTTAPIVLLKSSFLENTPELQKLLSSKIIASILDKPFKKQSLREIVHPYFYKEHAEDHLDIPIALDPIVKWENDSEPEHTEIYEVNKTATSTFVKEKINTTPNKNIDIASQNTSPTTTPDTLHTDEQIKKIITEQLNLFFKKQSQEIITELAKPIIQEYVQEKIKTLAKNIIEKEIQKMLNSSESDIPATPL